MPEHKVLIIIPALNESRVIDRLIREIKATYSHADILVVNDGSNDDTGSKAEAAGALVIDLPYNLGIGGAVQTGYKYAAQAGYDVAIQVDGDAQHDPKYLPALIDPVLQGRLDLCIGSRFLDESGGFKSTFARRIGIRFFAVMLSRLTGVHLTDPTSGFRASGKKLTRVFADYYPVDFPEPEAIHQTF